MTKEEAMQKYVEGLGEIIETMSFTDDVQSFVNSLENVNINLDDLELLAPGMKEKAMSHPNSPFNSRTNSPLHGSSGSENEEQVLQTKPKKKQFFTIFLLKAFNKWSCCGSFYKWSSCCG